MCLFKYLTKEGKHENDTSSNFCKEILGNKSRWTLWNWIGLLSTLDRFPNIRLLATAFGGEVSMGQTPLGEICNWCILEDVIGGLNRIALWSAMILPRDFSQNVTSPSCALGNPTCFLGLFYIAESFSTFAYLSGGFKFKELKVSKML